MAVLSAGDWLRVVARWYSDLGLVQQIKAPLVWSGIATLQRGSGIGCTPMAEGRRKLAPSDKNRDTRSDQRNQSNGSPQND